MSALTVLIDTKAVNTDYIVTRDIKDYAHSKVPAILPENLLKKLRANLLKLEEEFV